MIWYGPEDTAGSTLEVPFFQVIQPTERKTRRNWRA